MSKVSIPHLLIADATILADECGISFQEALGQTIGGTIYTVNEVLWKEGRLRVDTSLEGEFAHGVCSMLTQWFNSDFILVRKEDK